MARRLTTGALFAAVTVAALVLPACSSGGPKQAAPPSTQTGPSTSTATTTTPGKRPATFVATSGTSSAELQVYSTTSGKLVRDLPISGVPAGLHPGQGYMYVSSRQEVFWPSIGGSPVQTGSIVETPVAGGPSKVVTSGFAGIPSPDGSKLLVEESLTDSGEAPSSLAIYDLDTGQTDSLPSVPAIDPGQAAKSFAWLPDGGTVVAFYPGSPNCTGSSSCTPRAPAAWSLDTTSTGAGWRSIAGVPSSVAGATLLGPGHLSGTVAAEVSVGDPQLLTLTAVESMQVMDKVKAPGSCFSVDQGGTNFLCTTDTGQAATSSFAHPEPEVLSSGAVNFTSLAW